MFLASENIDFTGLSHVFLLGGGEKFDFSYLGERNSRWDAWKLNAEFAYSMIYGIKNEKHTKQYPKRANCDTMNPISKM